MNEAEWLSTQDLKAMHNFLCHGYTGMGFRKGGYPWSDRLKLLLGVACARSVWHLLTDEYWRKTVSRVEAAADGMLDLTIYRAEVRLRLSALLDASSSQRRLDYDTFDAGVDALSLVAWGPDRIFWSLCTDVWVPSGPDLLREIIGNPFCFTQWEDYWTTDLTVSLAKAAYQHQQIAACSFCAGKGFVWTLDEAEAEKLKAQSAIVSFNPKKKQIPCELCHKGRFNNGHLENDRLAILADALEDVGCTDDGILIHLRSPGSHVRGCWVLNNLYIPPDAEKD